MLIKYGISAIIVAVGEPKYIFQVIQSIFNIVTEVVVIDIGLSAEWKNQLKQMQKVQIIQEEPVEYVELLREKSKQYAKNDYILMLDPDEIVPKQLSDRLLEEYDKYDFISIPRKNIIFGKWIQHSRWWPDHQIRLFKKDSVTWSKKLHAQPKTKGNGLQIEPEEQFALTHHNYESLDEYMTKMMRYAKADAQMHLSSEEKFTLSQALSQGSSEFISRFFAADGYKNGMHGFVLSFLQLMYYPLVYFYYWEAKKYEQINTNTNIVETETFAKSLLYDILHWVSVKKLTHSSSNLKNIITRKLLK